MTRITPPTHDDQQEVRGNEAGTKGHHFGNEYDSHEHRKPGTVGVGTDGSGHGDGGVGIDPAGANRAAEEAIPPENGKRGWIDQRTGAVHGSGSGAGGGQPGEDFDSEAGGSETDGGGGPDRG
ncbi:hypothetical protein [Sphingomonas rubra]|uniref:Uncharacterized protein n=1 Tax=Sphingomonas rubra TaxID=634430 RepID=A0A1I5RTP3_9SPHN|nr:hypothetical protein [Sphingomonas rubra]SFP61631.1 hypothetical protein SAMN04488241_104102 [Sphingomonas rubra]